MVDRVLRGGRVLDPGQGLDARRDILIEGGLVSALGPPDGPETIAALASGAADHDVTGLLVTPGLVDLHGHWYIGSAYGIDPIASLGGCATTTVDAGTSGYVNFASFRRQSIDPGPVRVYAFVNVAALGIPYPLTGELEDLRYGRPEETADVIAANRDVAVGVKVRLSACGGNASAAFDLAVAAADRARVPIMVDIGSEGDLMPEVLDRMRAGDILTHCFTGGAKGIVAADGRISREARSARERGVRFDIGHGAGSFSWRVARAALADGFPPDSISTDLHFYSIDDPVRDLPTTLSKFLYLGLSLAEVIAKATIAPAASVGLPMPSLRPGSPADVAVLRLTDEPAPLRDATWTLEDVAPRLEPVLAIVGGRAVDPTTVDPAIRPATAVDRMLRVAGPMQDGGRGGSDAG